MIEQSTDHTTSDASPNMASPISRTTDSLGDSCNRTMSGSNGIASSAAFRDPPLQLMETTRNRSTGPPSLLPTNATAERSRLRDCSTGMHAKVKIASPIASRSLRTALWIPTADRPLKPISQHQGGIAVSAAHESGCRRSTTAILSRPAIAIQTRLRRTPRSLLPAGGCWALDIAFNIAG